MSDRRAIRHGPRSARLCRGRTSRRPPASHCLELRGRGHGASAAGQDGRSLPLPGPKPRGDPFQLSCTLGGAAARPTALPRRRAAPHLASPPANFSTARLATLDTKLPISPRGARDRPRSGCLAPAGAPTRGKGGQRVTRGASHAQGGEGGVPVRGAAAKRGLSPGAHLGRGQPRSRQTPPAVRHTRDPAVSLVTGAEAGAQCAGSAPAPRAQAPLSLPTPKAHPEGRHCAAGCVLSTR